jgi:hypothetical protein
MTYARARRRTEAGQTTNRCINCWHLDLPEWAPFCSWFCWHRWEKEASEV